jgi:hypothetical protein
MPFILTSMMNVSHFLIWLGTRVLAFIMGNDNSVPCVTGQLLGEGETCLWQGCVG